MAIRTQTTVEWYDSTCSMMARWQRGKLLESLAGVEHLLQPVMLLQPFRLILEVANIQPIAADRRVRGRRWVGRVLVELHSICNLFDVQTRGLYLVVDPARFGVSDGPSVCERGTCCSTESVRDCPC